MSKGGDKDRKALSANPPEREHYQVGYGKPPVATRFRPGESGNPHGRPKGARNRLPRLNEERLKGIILEKAYRIIKVRDGEKSVTVPIAQAVVRSLCQRQCKNRPRGGAKVGQSDVVRAGGLAGVCALACALPG